MSEPVTSLNTLRDQILEDPDIILEDPAVMTALAAANDRQKGENIVDLRGLAMQRMEARFDRLELTHQRVIAAAYENVSGTRQIHRATLAVLEPLDFTEFLTSLKSEIRDILSVDAIRLCLESPVSGHKAQQHLTSQYGDILGFYAPGSIEEYLTEGRNMAARDVTMRQVSRASDTLYGETAATITSEALLRLDLGTGNLPGMLALGSADPDMFHPNQGADLLTYFGAVFERAMRRWLK